MNWSPKFNSVKQLSATGSATTTTQGGTSTSIKYPGEFFKYENIMLIIINVCSEICLEVLSSPGLSLMVPGSCMVRLDANLRLLDIVG